MKMLTPINTYVLEAKFVSRLHGGWLHPVYPGKTAPLTLPLLSSVIDQYAKNPVKTKQELMLKHAEGFCSGCGWNQVTGCSCQASSVSANDNAEPDPRATPQLGVPRHCTCDVKNLWSDTGHDEYCPEKK